MNQEIKQRWVDALKSGQYQQGRETLRNKANQFCCLGVLCDLWVQEGHGRWEDGESIGYGIQLSGGLLELECLPPQVQAWAGLNNEIPDIRIQLGGMSEPREIDIAYLNDNEELTFEELARLVQEQL